MNGISMVSSVAKRTFPLFHVFRVQPHGDLNRKGYAVTLHCFRHQPIETPEDETWPFTPTTKTAGGRSQAGRWVPEALFC